MFNVWNETGLGAYGPDFPGNPGTGVDLGGRLIGKGGMILPAPPAHCPPDYRAKYIQVFGVDPGCTPMVETPYVAPTGMPAAPGTNAGPGIIPVSPPIPVTPAPPIAPTPVSPPVVLAPIGPRTTAPPRRHIRPGRGGEICPSYGHVNRQIPGVDEYQVIRCTPGQPVEIDRGLRRVVRQEALARHPAGGRERIGQAGDYQGGRRWGSGRGAPTGEAASTETGSGGSSQGQICLSPMVLIAAAVGAFFLFGRHR
jgi:hypothetical protein